MKKLHSLFQRSSSLHVSPYCGHCPVLLRGEDLLQNNGALNFRFLLGTCTQRLLFSSTGTIFSLALNFLLPHFIFQVLDYKSFAVIKAHNKSTLSVGYFFYPLQPGFSFMYLLLWKKEALFWLLSHTATGLASGPVLDQELTHGENELQLSLSWAELGTAEEAEIYYSEVITGRKPSCKRDLLIAI